MTSFVLFLVSVVLLICFWLSMAFTTKSTEPEKKTPLFWLASDYLTAHNHLNHFRLYTAKDYLKVGVLSYSYDKAYKTVDEFMPYKGTDVPSHEVFEDSEGRLVFQQGNLAVVALRPKDRGAVLESYDIVIVVTDRMSKEAVKAVTGVEKV